MCEYKTKKKEMHRHTMMLVNDHDGHKAYGGILGRHSMTMEFEFLEHWSSLWSSHQVYLILDPLETLMKKY